LLYNWRAQKGFCQRWQLSTSVTRHRSQKTQNNKKKKKQEEAENSATTRRKKTTTVAPLQ
jgi:hypothetical protein